MGGTVAGLLILATALLASSPVLPACDAACERRAAEALLAEGRARDAVAGLRDAVAAHPGDLPLSLLLARAYLAEDNLFWAERALRQAAERHPGDAGVLAWLACVHLRQGDPQLVAEDLRAEHRPDGGPEGARWSLLEAWRAVLAGDREAAAVALAAVSRRTVVFAEDRAQWTVLHELADAAWIPPLSVAALLAAGRTDNALAGAPTDPGEPGGASGVGRLELRARVVPPGRSARALAELEVFGEGFAAHAYRELGNLDASVRLGAVLPGERRRTTVAYRAGLLLLDQEPSRYAESHRVELERETAGDWVFFAGFGRRSYRDDRRSRWEGDVGIGGGVGTLAGAPLVVGATARLADADSPAYDQVGVSVAATTRIDVGRGRSARVSLTAAWDHYPDSGGARGAEVFGTREERRDLSGRLSIELAARLRRGLTAGVEVRLAARDSTADDAPGFDFDSREVRALATLRWRRTADPWAPRTVRPAGHVRLDWGLVGGEEEGAESILDLLRQDEELRRGSSCGVR